MKKLKLCRDCKWCKESEFGSGLDICSCMKNAQIINYSNGEAHSRYKYCGILRNEGWLMAWTLKVCGRSARFFEKKKGGKTK